jgi:hypothetical protein
MPPPRIASDDTSREPLTWPVASLVDVMLDRYVEWREYAAGVADAYTRWLEAPAEEEAHCYSAYLARLDQEESAATSYARTIRKLTRRLQRARQRSR